MPRTFGLARIPSGTPNIISFVITAAQAFKRGALLVDTAAGTVSECGADPASVIGVALADAFSNPGNDLGTVAVVTGGSANEVSVAIADRSQVFSARGVNGGTDPVTPAQTHIGEVYGVAKVGTDWVVDLAETTATVVEIVDIDIDQKLFLVKFREAVLALP